MRTLPAKEIELTVPFHDLDVMQIVWHANYGISAHDPILTLSDII